MHESFQKIDDLLKRGKTTEARLLLSKFKRTDIPKENWFQVAELYRRTQNPWGILYWLTKRVHPNPPMNPTATNQEKALYALGLSRIGAFTEAKALFSEINHKQVPIAPFYEALMYISQWDYIKAIPPLKISLKESTLSDYQKKVIQLNLFAALVSTRNFLEANNEFENLLPKIKDIPVLLGNLYEIKAQLLFNNQDYETAEQFIDKSFQQLSDESNVYHLLNKKWKAILLKAKNSPLADSELTATKQLSIQMKQWEIGRDCDFYKAYFDRNDRLFFQVYWGTRFRSYRNTLKIKYNWKGELPKYWDWQGSETHSSASEEYLLSHSHLNHKLDLSSGLYSPVSSHELQQLPLLKGNSLKILQFLTTDFYSPFHLGELQEFLYADQYFNIETTPLKLREIIRKTRLKLKEHAIPLDIFIKNKQVALGFKEDITLRCYRKHPVKKDFPEWIQIQKLFINHSFSAKDIAQSLKISPRSARRLALKLLKEKRIIKQFSGINTRYCIKK